MLQLDPESIIEAIARGIAKSTRRGVLKTTLIRLRTEDFFITHKKFGQLEYYHNYYFVIKMYVNGIIWRSALKVTFCDLDNITAKQKIVIKIN